MATAQRLRTYLTRDEVTQLLRVVKKTRHGARNHAMILLAYRHGLRASEVVGLRWSDVDVGRGTIYCRRAKGSRSTVHPLKRDEVAAIERLQRRSAGDYVFASERGECMSRSAFWLMWRAVPLAQSTVVTTTLPNLESGSASTSVAKP